MTLEEAIGVHHGDVDNKTGERISHEEKYDRIIEFLGGLDVVSQFIPFSDKQIDVAMESEKGLSSLRLKDWDWAAGYSTNSFGGCTRHGGGLWYLYHDHGITCASCSEGVCILKEAARLLWERRHEQEVLT